MRAVVGLVFAVSVTGCGIDPLHPTQDGNDRVTSGQAIVVALDARFTKDEETVIRGCFEEWRAFTNKNVNLFVSRGGGDLALERGPDPTGFWGYVSFADKKAWLSVDDAPDRLHLRCLALVGAATGWEHSGKGVLGAATQSDVFTPEDREECRRNFGGC